MSAQEKENGSDSGASTASLLNNFRVSEGLTDLSSNLGSVSTSSFLSSEKSAAQIPSSESTSLNHSGASHDSAEAKKDMNGTGEGIEVEENGKISGEMGEKNGEKEKKSDEVKDKSDEATEKSVEPKENSYESKKKSEESKKKFDESKQKSAESKEESDETKEKSDEVEEKPEWDDILGSGTVLKKTIKEGLPDSRPKRLQTLILRYECTLEDGTLIEKHENYKVQLGDFEILQGLDVAIGFMNVGEICQIKIEPRLAYGTKGLEPHIGPDTTVYFEVELKSIEPEIELETLSIAQRKELGNKKRERGNWWYGRDENSLAIQCYRRALDYLDEVEGGIKDPTPDGELEITDAALQELLEDRISVCNNMAAAQIKMGMNDAALNSLQTVLRCQPNNVKALFRKARVFRAKNDVATALSCLQKASEISPNNVDVQREILSLQALQQKQKQTERELARRMFNGPGTKSKETKEVKKETSKLYIWGTLGLSIAVGVLGIAAYKFKLA